MRFTVVSIHLMLLFIWRQQLDGTKGQGFNTSHVTLYPTVNGRMKMWIICFNTSHVTLYQKMGLMNEPQQFCFNTSHVTLYPASLAEVAAAPAFQYISCYSLSYLMVYHCQDYILFQYISCYSLSWRCKLPPGHSLMFQYISCYSLSVFHLLYP